MAKKKSAVEDIVFYIDAKGSDKNDGSENSPFATIGRALKSAYEAAKKNDIKYAALVVSGTLRLKGPECAAAGDTLHDTNDETAIIIANKDLPHIILRGKSEKKAGILDAQGNKRVIGIGTGNTLILRDHITITGGKEGGVCVEGSFIMEGGTISGNTAFNGAAVFVSDLEELQSSFVLRGGIIKDNTVTYPRHIKGCGGSICGGVIMEGGTIANTEGGRGIRYEGGIGEVVIKGGVIENNTLGGISIYCSSLKMSGGVIRNNTSDAGGGISVYEEEEDFQQTFIMEGGEIYGNSADNTGGGVRLHNCNFIMTGGTIENNSADGGGDNVYVGEGSSFEGDLEDGVDYE
ncbi:hypothetical protein AGMMS50293_13250 [Spirochaetia bacterium]|nr:hypothetical protein AGMMS50293_13250 [Spirochaetia bacterium]